MRKLILMVLTCFWASSFIHIVYGRDNTGSTCSLQYFIDQSDGACEATYPLARPLLNDYAQDRENKMNDLLGKIFVKSLVQDLENMAKSEKLFNGLGLQVEASQSCSLGNFEENFPCSNVDNERLKMLTKSISEDGIGSLSDLSIIMAKKYDDEVDSFAMESGHQCLSADLRNKLAMESMFENSDDISFEQFISYLETNENDRQFNERFKELSDQLSTFMPNFPQGLLELNRDGLSQGQESFSEVFTKLIDNNFSQIRGNLDSTCNGMFERISLLVCNEPDMSTLNNSDFSMTALQYEPEMNQTGFDAMSIEMMGGDVEQTFANFILNCSPECTNCDEHLQFDYILSEAFPKEVSSYVTDNEQTDRLESSFGANFDQVLCPLLACEQLPESLDEESCDQRSEWRSLEEIKDVIDCSADQFCEDTTYKALVRTFESFGAQAQAEQSGTNRTILSSENLGPTSFSSNFLGRHATVINEVSVNETVSPVGGVENTDISNVALEDGVETPNIPDLVSPDFTTERENLGVSRQAEVRQESIDEAAPIAQSDEPINANNAMDVNRPYRPANESEVLNSDGSSFFSTSFGRDGDVETSEQRKERLLADFSDVVDGVLDEQEQSDGRDRTLEALHKENRELLDRLNDRAAADGDPRVAANWAEALNQNGQTQDYNSRLNEAFDRNYTEAPEASVYPLAGGTIDQDKVITNEDKVLDNNSAIVDGQVNVGAGQGAVVAPRTGGSAESADPAKRAPHSLSTSERAITAAIENDELPQIETDSTGLGQMQLSDLEQNGIVPTRPFILVVKQDGRLIRIRVEPFKYRGVDVLAPELDPQNVALNERLKRSPLFKAYFDYGAM